MKYEGERLTEGGVSPAVRVVGLTKRYGERRALEDVSFSVLPGEFVVVLGPSGAGKTTLFRCLTRLVEPDAGEMYVRGRPLHTARGRELRQARREIGLIFQQFNLIRRMDALSNVLAGRMGHVATWRVLLRRFTSEDRQRAYAALDRVGLLEYVRQRADRLSGGQQQRVAIARVLAQESHVILADEPVASLDPESAASILGTLRAVAREYGIAVLCSLHQVNLATEYADRILGMRQGRLVADLTAEAFDGEEHARIYGGAAGRVS
jgi:phosphonate transport system ATP-binding protein